MIEKNKTTIALLAQQARTEHAELHHLLDTVRKQLGTSKEKSQQRAAPSVVAAVNELRDHVERHFDREEHGGWLEETEAHAPYLAHQLTKLERQHKPLRERAAHLVVEAEASEGTTTSTDQLRSDFETFARQLLMHENDEERVLQEGFNEDLDLT